MEMNSSSVRSGICRPDEAGEFGGMGGFKDFAPDGDAKRRDKPTATRLQHSAQRWRSEPDWRGTATLGDNHKMKTTLKELRRAAADRTQLLQS